MLNDYLEKRKDDLTHLNNANGEPKFNPYVADVVGLCFVIFGLIASDMIYNRQDQLSIPFILMTICLFISISMLWSIPRFIADTYVLIRLKKEKKNHAQ